MCAYLVAGIHFVGRDVRRPGRGICDREAVSRSDGSKTSIWSIDGAGAEKCSVEMVWAESVEFLHWWQSHRRKRRRRQIPLAPSSADIT